MSDACSRKWSAVAWAAVLLAGWAASAQAELVGRWSLDGTLQNSAQPLPNGAYFLLDENAATPADDPPTFVAGPAWLAGAQAVSLPGPSDPEGNGRVDGPFVLVFDDELGIAPAEETQSWTLTSWFRIDSQPAFAVGQGGSGAAGLVVNGQADGGQQNQFGFGLQELPASQYGLVYNAGGEAARATSFTSLVENVWYFVAQVSDATADRLSVYLWDSRDGDPAQLVSEAVGTATPLWLQRVYEMEIGWDPCCVERLFDGAIADVRLYNQSLSPTELQDVIWPTPAVPGDLNGDDVVDASDMDLLSAAVRVGQADPIYDLNRDRQVNDDDRVVWVEQIQWTWFGDANLNGEFNSGDLVDVLATGRYEDNVPGNAGWAEGDWDGDGDFTSGDFVLALSEGGYEQGPRPPAAVPVPEPLWSAWSMVGAGLLLRRLRKKTPPVSTLTAFADPASAVSRLGGGRVAAASG